MRASSTIVGAVLALAGALLIAGCDRGASAPAREHASEQRSTSTEARGEAGGGADRTDAAPASSETYASRDGGERRETREETPLWHGEPLWADNRQHSAKENAEYQCEHHGAEIGAKGYDDCLAKAHAFIKSPPSGAETVVRGNGDKLIYDKKSGIFAVARRDGAPRTIRKPDDGDAFWAKQKEEASSGARYHRRGSDEGGDRGGAGNGNGG